MWASPSPMPNCTKEMQERNRILMALQRAGAAFASTLDLNVVLRAVTRYLAELFDVECAAISEWDRASNSIPVIAQYDPNGVFGDVVEEYNLDEYRLSRRSLEERRVYQYTISQPDTDPVEKAYMERFGLKTVLRFRW